MEETTRFLGILGHVWVVSGLLLGGILPHSRWEDK